jgi:hypothetical protein
MKSQPIIVPGHEECSHDEVLLVHATGYTGWFIDALEALEIAWESIDGCPSWIEFEIPSCYLQLLMNEFFEVYFDILA